MGTRHFTTAGGSRLRLLDAESLESTISSLDRIISFPTVGGECHHRLLPLRQDAAWFRDELIAHSLYSGSTILGHAVPAEYIGGSWLTELDFQDGTSLFNDFVELLDTLCSTQFDQGQQQLDNLLDEWRADEFTPPVELPPPATGKPPLPVAGDDDGMSLGTKIGLGAAIGAGVLGVVLWARSK